LFPERGWQDGRVLAVIDRIDRDADELAGPRRVEDLDTAAGPGA
jgi:hypothetical protein